MLYTFDNRNELVKSVFKDAATMANFSKLRVDVVKKQVEGGSLAQAESAIRTKMFEVAGLQPNARPQEIRAALRKTAVREAIFEIISETAEDTLVSGWGNDPFFMRYVDIQNYNLGQTNIFYIPDNTDIIISQVSASNHDITRQRLGVGRQVAVQAQYYGAKIYMEAERYMMGVEDWASLIGKISIAFTRQINTQLHNAVMSAGSTLPSPTQWNVTGELDATNYPDFVKLINDVSIATGSQPVIMGTKVALSGLKNMGDVDWASNDAKDDIYRMGRLGQFEGTEIVEIPQVFAPNDTSKYLVDDTKLLIMPGNIDRFIKMYYDGDTQIREITDQNTLMDGTYEYEMVMKYGIAVLTNTRFGTWTIE